MPLSISSGTGLELPSAEFNADGLAVIMISGGRYGGQWVMGASAKADGPKLGEFWADSGPRDLTGDPCYPDLAIETAFVWLRGETARLGLRLVGFENLNRHYDADSRPYFCLARAIIASPSFVPVPGARYAEEQTPDEATAFQS